MIRFMTLLLFVICFNLMTEKVFAQTPTNTTDPNNTEKTDINPRFAKMTKEVGVVCGQLLPNSIKGITEMMPLCGGRIGLKIGQTTFMEPMFILGASKGQRYMQGSLSFRGDYSLDEFVGSMYAGADLHYATSPVYSQTPPGEETNINIGFHIGGALWWELNDITYLRMDIKNNFNPGTSLFVALSFILRFDPASNEAQQQSQ